VEKLSYPEPVDLSRFSRSRPKPEALYGLPSEVKFCTKCVISNQRPNSAVEYQHTRRSRKVTIHFDERGVCDACTFGERKRHTIDWASREKQLRDLCDKHRRHDGGYDCIVPGSGGKENRGFDCYGVDPSSEAVKFAKQRGLDARQGTAESLPFDDSAFDIVVFGFCLYLCDRDDLFRIASEADRVLKNPGWLLILDFFSPTPTKREYHHRSGLFSYKMDYRTLFTWNPAYTTVTHRVRHHSEDTYTDDRNEWTATSVRKNLNDG